MKRKLKWLYVRWLEIKVDVLHVLEGLTNKPNVQLQNAARKADAEYMDAWLELILEDIPELREGM